MTNDQILAEAAAYARQTLEKDSSGHDWWHIYRVTQLAKTLAKAESADAFVCELAALLHDIADEKLTPDPVAARHEMHDWLVEHHVPEATIEHVHEIIDNMSFKGGHNKPMRTLEGRVVQDADRLDAIGAIGIARTFAYAGAKGNLAHNPELKPRENMTAAEYRNGESTAVNHFYEKLLLLKDRLNTDSAKKLAEERHHYMEGFLAQFFAEWEGKR